MKRLIIAFLFFIVLNSISFGQRYFIVEDSLHKCSIIDKANKNILNRTFTAIEEYGKYLIVTDSLDNKGVFNTRLKEILPTTYEEIKTTCTGWIYAKKNNKYGFYDSLGKQITPHIYDDVCSFLNDSSLVILAELNQVKLLWIGKNGDIIRKGKIEEKNLQNHCSWSNKLNSIPYGLKRKKNKVGIFINTKWLIEPYYDKIECTPEGYYIVKKENLNGLYNKNGILIAPLKYLHIKPR